MGFTSNTEADGALCSRVEDVRRLCDRRRSPCFLGFLDLREQAVVRRCLPAKEEGQSWGFMGGYEDAERRLLVVCPDYMELSDVALPICAIGFRYRPVRKLTHRDFLGTLLSAGIRRDKIGDILCGEGLSVIFLHSDMATFICDEIQRIGGEGVSLCMDYDGELPLNHTYEERRETIASPRLDCVVKALLRCSREEAAQQIRIGMVAVDHQVTENVSYMLTAPCTLSVRGCGRFQVDQFGPKTKKGRLTLLARKCL